MSNISESKSILDLSLSCFSPIASSSQHSKIFQTQLNNNLKSSNIFNSKQWQAAQDEHYKQMDISNINTLKINMKKSTLSEFFLVASVFHIDCEKSSVNSTTMTLKDPTGEIKAVFLGDIQQYSKIVENSVLVLNNFNILVKRGGFVSYYLCFKEENVVDVYLPENVAQFGFTQKKILFTQKICKTQNVNVNNNENVSLASDVKVKHKDDNSLRFEVDLNREIESECKNNIVQDKNYTLATNNPKKFDKNAETTNAMMGINESTSKINTIKENLKKFVFKHKNSSNTSNITRNINENDVNLSKDNQNFDKVVIKPSTSVSKENLQVFESCTTKKSEINDDNTEKFQDTTNSVKSSNNSMYLIPNLDFDFDCDFNDESTLKIDVLPLNLKKNELKTHVIGQVEEKTKVVINKMKNIKENNENLLLKNSQLTRDLEFDSDEEFALEINSLSKKQKIFHVKTNNIDLETQSNEETNKKSQNSLNFIENSKKTRENVNYVLPNLDFDFDDDFLDMS